MASEGDSAAAAAAPAAPAAVGADDGSVQVHPSVKALAAASDAAAAASQAADAGVKGEVVRRGPKKMVMLVFGYLGTNYFGSSW